MWADNGAVFMQGRMPENYWEGYSTLAKNGMIAYTVMSYNTPIAWVTTSGTVYVPDLKYSNTTTAHQNLCKVYL